ncbi:MAG: hypothetical protein APF76_12270 [Desulfitibacter sp. BRH_c19]|nr:MAG: hypothetical protein APF76_12270 [Desulfitibacter sp. BRH_c19]
MALALAPLIRISSISLPLAEITFILWYPIISVPLLVAAFLIKSLMGISFREMGYSFSNFQAQLIIGTIGIPLGVIHYQILKPVYSDLNLVANELWFTVLVLIICTGFLEEFIFRGILFRASVEVVGNKALLYVSCIYSVMHIAHGSLVNVIFVFLVAILFTKILIWQKNIIGISLAHGLMTVTLYVICPALLY